MLFTQNEAGVNGGGIYVNADGPIDISIKDTTFARNEASDGGGFNAIVRPTTDVDFENTSFNQNRAENQGGGIYLIGDPGNDPVMLVNSAVTDNEADNGGGGIFSFNPLSAIDSKIEANSTPRQGAGIFNGSHLVLERVDLDRNRATGSGGGLMTIVPETGPSDSSTTIRDSRVTRNTTQGLGAGVTARTFATIERSLIEGNVSTDDAGGLNLYGGSLVTESTIIHNTAAEGGGVFTANLGHRFENSVIASNHATSAFEGGGGFFNIGELTLENVTVSGNSAVNIGGAIYSKQTILEGNVLPGTGVINLSHVTMVDNSASSWGAIYNRNGEVRADNTIFANHDGSPDLLNPDILHQAILLDGNNIVDVASTLEFTESDDTNLIGDANQPIDVLIGPLQDNGGPTLTHALLSGSPAIDAGDSILTLDQRGSSRPNDGDNDGNLQVDIGAYEL